LSTTKTGGEKPARNHPPPPPPVTSFVSLSYPILYNFLESSTIIFKIKVLTF
jgi:hypothetical protein